VAELTTRLNYFDYEVTELHLSRYLKDLNWDLELPEDPFDVRVWEHMSAGSELRARWNRGDALALLALTDIDKIRRDQTEETDDDDNPAPLNRHAFVLNSLKHPDEVATLRSIFGPRFFLIGAYSPREARRQALTEKIADSRGDPTQANWDHRPDDLIGRDESEGERLGQRLRDTYHRADIFVDARDDNGLREELERVLDIVFGAPFATPTLAEYAMFEAEGASRRSAEPGRQVGAAIADADGSIISLGTNEVPAPGGGLYSDESDPDHREWKQGVETNARRQREIAEAIRDELASREMLSETGVDNPQAILDALLDTELGDLTEFGRAVHAEMAALLDAATRGVSVKGATVYTTTFPCHNCARHIIAAGIDRVVYIAPYAKSKAWQLHEDAIAIAAAEPPQGKVHFEPFVGVAPRRYLELFDAAWKESSEEHLARKDPDTGELAQFDARRLPAVLGPRATRLPFQAPGTP
jgi:cytidine deaminase